MKDIFDEEDKETMILVDATNAFCGVMTRWTYVLNSTVAKGHQVQTEHSIDMRAIYI